MDISFVALLAHMTPETCMAVHMIGVGLLIVRDVHLPFLTCAQFYHTIQREFRLHLRNDQNTFNKKTVRAQLTYHLRQSI